MEFTDRIRSHRKGTWKNISTGVECEIHCLANEESVVVYEVVHEDEDVYSMFATPIEEFLSNFTEKPHECCSCGTTENLHYEGRWSGYRCNSLGCVPF